MAKVKKTGTSHYEILFIIPNKFTEEEAKGIAEKVKKNILDQNGEVTRSEDWGKKRLAYEINHFNHGYYSLLEFDLKAENLNKIDQTLRMSHDVLRHQIVVKKIRSSEEIERDKKIAGKIANKEEVKKKQVKEEAKAKDVKKMELKDLDEKLDKILDTDDLL